jgi:hypothetical protein
MHLLSLNRFHTPTAYLELCTIILRLAYALLVLDLGLHTLISCLVRTLTILSGSTHPLASVGLHTDYLFWVGIPYSYLGFYTPLILLGPMHPYFVLGLCTYYLSSELVYFYSLSMFFTHPRFMLGFLTTFYVVWDSLPAILFWFFTQALFV